MNYRTIFCFGVIFSMLTACAARQESVSTRPPKKLITRDDYVDLKIKPHAEEPFVVDYKNEGTERPSIDTGI